jgi:metal-responsive CopG/Arc/MetJ family transcriptional regulator
LSKGSPKVYVRFPADLLKRVDATCERLVHSSRAAPPDRSEFIRRCVVRELAHMERSAKWRQRKNEQGNQSEGDA